MKGKKRSPGCLKQAKITSFWAKEAGNGGGTRKRKNDEAGDQPTPKALKFNCDSPDLFRSSTPNLNFSFEDFENDPFSSPKKENSPRKKVLGENFSQEDKKSDLSFENPVKCRVVRSTVCRFEVVLEVKDEKSEEEGVCKLRDAWSSCSFSAGEVVTIQAAGSKDGWVVDNKNGFVVADPDTVVSSTSLVSSIFCLRQGILSNFYKSVGAGNSEKMLIGRVVHELFQECLKDRSSTDEDISRVIANLTTSREYLRDFYLSDLSVSGIRKELENFVPHVKNFVDVYVNKKPGGSGKNFEGSIESVLDIEEMIRSPRLGVQGRVDVTVRMKSRNSEKVAPLELKTGRASFSSEHRSQLTLYVLLMKELERKVESGLLLYLKEDIMEEITPQRDEIRNLFLLRNQYVRFYKSFRNYELPDPIRNVKACSRCPHLRTCIAYLMGRDFDGLPDSHPLRTVQVSDIKPSHVDYFVEWNKMLWLEYEDAEEEEVSGLRLETGAEGEGEFNHDFRKDEAGKKSIRPGSFVLVLDGKSRRICTGRVTKDTESVLSLTTDKKLEDRSEIYKVKVFQSKFLSFYFTNLGLLLEEEFKDLREIIIEKRLPIMNKKLDKKEFEEKCLRVIMDLNKSQQEAVLKCLLAEDYLLIKGPPGTGKTQTVVALVRVLVALGKRVLIVSHTHSSVDNILLKLDDIEFLRLGASKSVHKNIRRHCFANLIENCSTVEEVGKLFGRQVIASTCLGLDIDFVRKEKFDVCIVDESSQVLQPEVLRPLFCSKKFVLVGDEDQLPPVVLNPHAKNLGMDISIFEWLRKESATSSLSHQYRMNSAINALANAIAYDGLVECANEAVAHATLAVAHPEVLPDDWTRDVLSGDLDKSVVFVDTSSYFEKAGSKAPEESRSSSLEAAIIVWLVDCMLKAGLEEKSIGIIAPFCEQVAVLKKKSRNLPEVEINTVDQYQGRDKDVILFSCTKENLSSREAGASELLNDKKRLTVAVTRAKHKLIVVGDRMTVVKYLPFQKLLKSLKESQLVSLPDDLPWENFGECSTGHVTMMRRKN